MFSFLLFKAIKWIINIKNLITNVVLSCCIVIDYKIHLVDVNWTDMNGP